MAFQGEVARTLSDIDQLVYNGIMNWGGDAAPTKSSLNYLLAAKSIATVSQVPLEDLKSVHRLRLYAYAFDVLELLGRESSQAIASSARSFILDVSCAVEGVAKCSPDIWSKSMQAILSAPKGREQKCDPDLICQVMHAVRQINHHCLPEPVDFKAQAASIRTNPFTEQQAQRRPKQTLWADPFEEEHVPQQQESNAAWCLKRIPREERRLDSDLTSESRLLDEGAVASVGALHVKGSGSTEKMMGPVRTSPFKARSAPFPIIDVAEDSPDPIVDATPPQGAAPLQPVGSVLAGPASGSSNVVQHRAHASACTVDGKSLVADRRVPGPRSAYSRWTPQEEARLIEGHKRYGDHWNLIQTGCKLQNKTPIQLKDKWRNLVKYGHVTITK